MWSMAAIEPKYTEQPSPMPVNRLIQMLLDSNTPHSIGFLRPFSCAISGVNPYAIPKPITITIMNMLCTKDTAAKGMVPAKWPTTTRSEEHTSELQSLMRISYAVFCLKKKTQQHTHKNY